MRIVLKKDATGEKRITGWYFYGVLKIDKNLDPCGQLKLRTSRKGNRAT